MKKKTPGLGSIEQEIAIICFTEMLNDILSDGIVDEYVNAEKRSARKVQKKIVGIRADEGEEYDNLYLFPELLLRRLRKRYFKGCRPLAFWRKKDFSKMLTRADLIIRTDDGSVEHEVCYHDNIVKAWRLNVQEFCKWCDQPTFFIS